MNAVAGGWAGGLVGEFAIANIIQCYYAGSIKVREDVKSGGICGIAELGARALQSYWDTESSGQQHSALHQVHGAFGKTTAEMKNPLTFPWDRKSVWKCETGQYPRLRTAADGVGQNFSMNVHTTGAGAVSDGASGPGLGIRYGSPYIPLALHPGDGGRVAQVTVRYLPSGFTEFYGDTATYPGFPELAPGQTYYFYPPNDTDNYADVTVEFTPTVAKWGIAEWNNEPWGNDTGKQQIANGWQGNVPTASFAAKVSRVVQFGITGNVPKARFYESAILSQLQATGTVPEAAFTTALTKKAAISATGVNPVAAFTGAIKRAGEFAAEAVNPLVSFAAKVKRAASFSATGNVPEFSAFADTGSSWAVFDAVARNPIPQFFAKIVTKAQFNVNGNTPSVTFEGTNWTGVVLRARGNVPQASFFAETQSSRQQDGTVWNEDLWARDYWGAGANINRFKTEGNVPAASFAAIRRAVNSMAATGVNAVVSFAGKCTRKAVFAATGNVPDAAFSTSQNTRVFAELAMTGNVPFAGFAVPEPKKRITAAFDAIGNIPTLVVQAVHRVKQYAEFAFTGNVPAARMAAVRGAKAAFTATGVNPAVSMHASRVVTADMAATGSVPAASFDARRVVTGTLNATGQVPLVSMQAVRTVTANLYATGNVPQLDGFDTKKTVKARFDAAGNVPDMAGHVRLASDILRWYRVESIRYGGVNQPVRIAELAAVKMPIRDYGGDNETA